MFVDPKIAITLMGSLLAFVGVALVVSLLTAWATGISALDIVNTILGFFYKVWDTVLSFFFTLVNAAPPILKMLFWVGLFWVFGGLILSSTVGVTNVCSPNDGKLYNLGFGEGLAFSFFPDDVDYSYVARTSSTILLRKDTFGWGKGTATNGTSNFAGGGKITVPADVVAAYDVQEEANTGCGASSIKSFTSWLSKTSKPGVYSGDPKGQYPVITFSVCRRKIGETRADGSIVGADGRGECVLWLGSCNTLVDVSPKSSTAYAKDVGFFGTGSGSKITNATPGKSLHVATFDTVFEGKYDLKYYQGSNATEIRTELNNKRDCPCGPTDYVCKIKCWFGQGELTDLTKCWTIPTTSPDTNLFYIGNAQRSAPTGSWWNPFDAVRYSADPDYDLPMIYDAKKETFPAVVNEVDSKGKIISTTAGLIYNAASIDARIAVAGEKKSIYAADGKSVCMDTKTQFLAERPEDLVIPNKLDPVYFDCVKNPKTGKYSSELYVFRLPIFSMQFIFLVVAITAFVAFLSFVNLIRDR